jgi:hypothetical protein
MNDRTFDQLLDAWLDLGPTSAPERVADAARLEARGTRQTAAVLGRRLPQRWMDMNRMVRFGVAAAVVALSIVGLAYLTGRNVAAPSPSLAPPGSAAASPATAPSLPQLGLPGARANVHAGEYGWQTGAPQSGMHSVVPDGDSFREVAMFFASGPDCLRQGERDATPVRIAGFDGVFVEPYEPAMAFGSADGDEITRAYALAVEDRTLCVYVTRHPTTTDADLRAVRDILETIKAQPIGEQAIRITFTLPAGWDTG